MRLELSFFERIYNGPPQLARAGYLFAYRIEGVYRFGRVIRTNLPMGQSPNASAQTPGEGQLNLTYFYSPAVSDPTPPLPSLTKDKLLIAPQLIWKDCWMHGAPVFLPIETRPLQDFEILAQHCFKSSYRGYVDEMGRPITNPSDLCGEYSIILLNRLSILLAQGIGLIHDPNSIAEITNLSTVTTLNVPTLRKDGIDITVCIPLQDFIAMDVDMYELESDLNALLYPKYGKWVETITGAGDRRIVFEVKPQHIHAAINKLQGTLKSIGFRNYQVSQATPD